MGSAISSSLEFGAADCPILEFHPQVNNPEAFLSGLPSRIDAFARCWYRAGIPAFSLIFSWGSAHHLDVGTAIPQCWRQGHDRSGAMRRFMCRLR